VEILIRLVGKRIEPAEISQHSLTRQPSRNEIDNFTV